MEKPFDVSMQVLLPDGTKQDLTFNLFELKKEFPCMVCAAIGEDEKISMQSWSDHFARHYVENNRVGEINKAITADLAKPVPAHPVQKLRNELPLYDQAVTGDMFRGGVTRRQDPIVYVNYPNSYDETTEEQLVALAMAESLRESELAEKLKGAEQNSSPAVVNTQSAPADDTKIIDPATTIVINTEVSTMSSGAISTEVGTTVSTNSATPVITYPKRKKKDT